MYLNPVIEEGRHAVRDLLRQRPDRLCLVVVALVGYVTGTFPDQEIAFIQPAALGQQPPEEIQAPVLFVLGLYGPPVILRFSQDPAVVGPAKVTLHHVLLHAGMIIPFVPELAEIGGGQYLPQEDVMVEPQALHSVLVTGALQAGLRAPFLGRPGGAVLAEPSDVLVWPPGILLVFGDHACYHLCILCLCHPCEEGKQEQGDKQNRGRHFLSHQETFQQFKFTSFTGADPRPRRIISGRTNSWYAAC